MGKCLKELVGNFCLNMKAVCVDLNDAGLRVYFQADVNSLKEKSPGHCMYLAGKGMNSKRRGQELWSSYFGGSTECVDSFFKSDCATVGVFSGFFDFFEQL